MAIGILDKLSQPRTVTFVPRSSIGPFQNVPPEWIITTSLSTSPLRCLRLVYKSFSAPPEPSPSITWITLSGLLTLLPHIKVAITEIAADDQRRELRDPPEREKREGT